jgi:hypothetical protein
MYMTERPETNRLAIIALTLGILSIFLPIMGLPLGLVGIFMSIIAKKEIARTNGYGDSFATAGLICSIIGLLFQLILILIGVLSFYSEPIGG